MTFSFSAISATLLHVAIARAVTVHALLYKRSVGAAMSWMGIAWLSPFVGGVLYFTFGINRVKRRARRLRNERSHLFIVDEAQAGAGPADPMSPLEHAIGRLTGLPMEAGNEVEVLRSGDEAYPAMLAAIDGAEMSIGLSSYIFRADEEGTKFIDALVRAAGRGVAVRVLIDTGATAVALTPEDAKRIGVDVDLLVYNRDVNTALGMTHAAPVILSHVSVEGADVSKVEALVVPQGLSASLLGMSYLGRLESFNANRQGMVLRP